MNAIKHLCLLSLVIFSSCIREDIIDDRVEPVLRINSNRDPIQVGASLQLEYTYVDHIGEVVAPDMVTWMSSNPSIITVDQEGLATAEGIGSVVITATATAPLDQEAITDFELESVGFEPSFVIGVHPDSLTVNDNFTFTYSYTDELGNPNESAPISWFSGDTSLFSIGQDGRGIGKGIGGVTLSAIIESTTGIIQATTSLYIAGLAPTLIINNPVSILATDTAYQFDWTFTDELGIESTEQSIKWFVVEESIGQIDENGLLTTLSEGSTEVSVTVTTPLGITLEQSILLEVIGKEEEIIRSLTLTLSGTIENLLVSNTHQLDYLLVDQSGMPIVPIEVSWISSDTTIARISESGLISPTGIGQVTLSLLLTDEEGLTATEDHIIEITGFDPTLVLNNPLEELALGSSHQLSYTYTDELGLETTPAFLQWVSSDEAVIEVDALGQVVALSAGSSVVTVTATSLDGQIVETELTITVPEPTVVDVIRRGSMSSASGYGLRGDFSLRVEGEELVLEFEDNYNFDGAPGPILYLSNNPTTPASTDYQVGGVTATSGAHTYRIPLSEVGLDDFSHLLYWCEPFNIRLGFGSFE